MTTTTVATHTPGPWRTDGLYDGPRVYVAGPDDITVARCNHAERTNEQAEANARLIAAAPELLAALRDFLKYSEKKIFQPMIFRHQPALGKLGLSTGK